MCDVADLIGIKICQANNKGNWESLLVLKERLKE
jgi:hypothetical protein